MPSLSLPRVRRVRRPHARSLLCTCGPFHPACAVPGACICEQNRCGGASICEHNRIRRLCGGEGMCAHKRVKSKRKDCKERRRNT
jgi:hypothetical protein